MKTKWTRRRLADFCAPLVGLVVLIGALAYVLSAPTLPEGAPPSSPTPAIATAAPPPSPSSARPSVLDRAFTDEFLQLLRIGLLVVGAYFIAALVQRVILGQYGGFKAGPVEFAQLAEEADKKVIQEVGKFTARTKETVRAQARALRALKDAQESRIAALNGRLDEVEDRVDSEEAERRLDRGK